MEKIGLEAILNLVNFNKGRDIYNQGIDGMSKKTSSLSGLLSGAGKAIAGVSVAAAGMALGGIAAAAKVLSTTITPASDLSESMNKVRVVFADSGQEMITWSQSAASSLGMSQQQALEAAGTYGNLFAALGIGQKQAAGMSQELLQLAADLGSFNNLAPDVVLEKLRAGLTGEAEPLKSLGVNLNEVTIKAKALDMGLVKASVDMTKVKTATVTLGKKQEAAAKALKEHGEGSKEYYEATVGIEAAEAKLAELMDGKVGDLSASAKAQAAYALIMEQTSLAQGDFARTSEGLANQQKILAATMTDVKARIGTALLPTLEYVQGQFIEAFNSPKMQAAIAKLTGWLETNLPLAIQKVQDWVSGSLVPAFTKVWEFIEQNVVPALKTAYEWLQTHLPEAIATARRWFLYTFKPALIEVWDWMQIHLVPLFTEVWTLLSQTIPEAIGKLDWQKLQPGTLSENLAQMAEGIDAITSAIQAINNGEPIDWKRLFGPAAQPGGWNAYGEESFGGFLRERLKDLGVPEEWLDLFNQKKPKPGGAGPTSYAPNATVPMASAAGAAGGKGGVTTIYVSGDTFIQHITDPVSMALAMALVNDRKRDRWNAAMGVAS